MKRIDDNSTQDKHWGSLKKLDFFLSELNEGFDTFKTVLFIIYPSAPIQEEGFFFFLY